MYCFKSSRLSLRAWGACGSRRTMLAIISLLPCGSRGLSPHCQPWWQAPLPTEPSYQPYKFGHIIVGFIISSTLCHSTFPFKGLSMSSTVKSQGLCCTGQLCYIAEHDPELLLFTFPLSKRLDCRRAPPPLPAQPVNG